MERYGQEGKLLFVVTFLVMLALVVPASASPIVISGVPAYYSYHGCEPTAIAMILGYYDLRGYSNLFGAQGNALYLTSSVQDEISSPAHNAKYDYADNPDLPTPPYTSIADWLGTGVDPLTFGDSSYVNGVNAIIGYAAYKGYTFQASNMRFSTASWTTLIDEVNSGRPMMFAVDLNADGILDHAVPVFGYDDRGVSGKWYACFPVSSEDRNPSWFQYQTYAPGNAYGIGYITQVAPIPEPVTIVFLLAGAFLLRCHKKT